VPSPFGVCCTANFLRRSVEGWIEVGRYAEFIGTLKPS
jgi:hypothetical protein